MKKKERKVEMKESKKFTCLKDRGGAYCPVNTDVSQALKSR